MKILALDLGTKTGWATWDGTEGIRSGTWVLATPKEVAQQKAKKLDRCCDMRATRLLENITAKGVLNFIYFEDVQFASTSMQAHLWGGFRAIVSLFHPTVNIVAVPVGTLKKFATGNGAADKDQMREALPEYFFANGLKKDDNEIDALHLLRLAIQEQKETL